MTTIYTFAQSAIEDARSAGRYGTANLYSEAVNSFRRFTGNTPLTFKEVTAGMIKKYEESLLQKGRRHNTISAYMRMLRSIFNQAYLQGVPDTIPADELFRFVFTGYEPTVKRAISPALIRRLSQLNLEQSPNLRFSRDLFLLSFYLRGIPFVDLVHLRKTDMRHNTIYYYRRKTRQQLSVYIEPYAAEILRRYADKHSPYLLPILSSVGPEGYRQYKSALRLYNQHLHRLSKNLRQKVPLTYKVTRHSWATTAKEEGVAIAMISEGLGHSSEKVTHVYLASFNNNAMSKANRKVISTIHSKNKKGKVKK